MLNWANGLQVGKLPLDFVNPFDIEIVGQRPRRDPLRLPVFPQARRIELVSDMDEWQLTHLALSVVLPLRPEDCAGLLIDDVDLTQNSLKLGTRFGGRDFTKGRVSFVVPIPKTLVPLLNFCVVGRADGPLLRCRAWFEGRRQPQRVITDACGTVRHLEDAFCTAARNVVKTAQDQKRLVRKTLRELGGVSSDELSREFKIVLKRVGHAGAGRFYDLRSSISTELDRSGVSHLVQRYVTGHSCTDIMNEYVCLDPAQELAKYFATVQPLLDALHHRAIALGLKLPGHESNVLGDTIVDGRQTA